MTLFLNTVINFSPYYALLVNYAQEPLDQSVWLRLMCFGSNVNEASLQKFSRMMGISKGSVNDSIAIKLSRARQRQAEKH